MSLPPITIPELSPADPVDPDNDYVVLRQNLSDKKATVASLRDLKLQLFPPLGRAIAESDVFLIGENNGMGGYTNKIVASARVVFFAGVNCWFFSNVAPIGWVIIPNTGDKILGCSYTFNPAFPSFPTELYKGVAGQSIAGTWQQEDVDGVSGRGLNIQQIPNHNHWCRFGNQANTASARYIVGAQNRNQPPNTEYGNDAVRGIVNGQGDNSSHNNYGECLPHNHGATWRPLALVGIVATKTV